MAAVQVMLWLKSLLLLYTTSFVTLEEVKTSNSKVSYFTAGWVMEYQWRVFPESGSQGATTNFLLKSQEQVHLFHAVVILQV